MNRLLDLGAGALLAGVFVLAVLTRPQPAPASICDQASGAGYFDALNVLIEQRREAEALAENRDFVDRHLRGDASYFTQEAAAFKVLEEYFRDQYKKCL